MNSFFRRVNNTRGSTSEYTLLLSLLALALIPSINALSISMRAPLDTAGHALGSTSYAANPADDDRGDGGATDDATGGGSDSTTPGDKSPDEDDSNSSSGGDGEGHGSNGSGNQNENGDRRK